jgi:PST family polysaccharide transporter
VLVLAAAASARVPVIGDDPRLVWSAVAWAIGQGFHPLWYYQGSEHVRPVLVLDVAANVLAIAGVLWLCRAAGDGWKVLAMQAASALFVALAGHGLAIRTLAPRLPSWNAVRARLANGAGLFAYRLAVSAYTVANPLVLGMVAPATVVGYFAAAEKIVKTLFVAAIHPLNQAWYPRASRLGGRGLDARLVAAFALAGGAAGAAVVGAAPWLCALVFGREFGAATAPLRILALLLPILSVSTAIVMHRMLPGGRDRLLLAITIAAGALNVALAAVLAPALGAVGMAAGVVTVEAAVLLAVAGATSSRTTGSDA